MACNCKNNTSAPKVIKQVVKRSIAPTRPTTKYGAKGTVIKRPLR